MMLDDFLAFVRENPAFSIFAAVVYTIGFIGAAVLIWLRYTDKKRRRNR